MNVTIHKATDGDRVDIRRIHTKAFGQTAEAELVDALVDGGFATASLVAKIDGRAIAHVLFSKLDVVGAARPITATALAPVAVLPGQQGQGHGSRLIRGGLDACRANGVDMVFVVGEPAYYGRFGFSAPLAARFDSPYAGSACMALAFTLDTAHELSGTLHYAAPFEALA